MPILPAVVLLTPFMFILLLVSAALLLIGVDSVLAYNPTRGIIYDLTADNYRVILTDPLYRRVMMTTFKLSIVTTVLTICTGYPLVWLLVGARHKLASLGILFLIIPLWTSVVVRTYGVITLITREGVLNSLLQSLGFGFIVDIYPGFWSTVLGLWMVCLPLAAVPMYVAVRGIDRALLEASLVLGAGWINTFIRIGLPLSLPGIFGGAVLSFVTCISAYITPVLLGSPRELVIPVLIERQINVLYNLPGAAALGIVLLTTTSVIVLLVRRWVQVERLLAE